MFMINPDGPLLSPVGLVDVPMNPIVPVEEESELAKMLREYDEEQEAGSRARARVETRITNNGGFLGVPDLQPAIAQKVLGRFDGDYPWATIISRPIGRPVEHQHRTGEMIVDMVYEDMPGFKDMAVILRKDNPEDEKIYIMMVRKARQHMVSEASERIKKHFDDAMYMVVPQTDQDILFEGYLVPIPGTKQGFKQEWGFEPVITEDLVPERTRHNARRMDGYKKRRDTNARKYLLPPTQKSLIKQGGDVLMEGFLASNDSYMVRF